MNERDASTASGSPAGDTNTITTSGAKGLDATGAGTSLGTASVIDDLTVTTAPTAP